MITKETYRLFCIENNYFTLGCNLQYEKALHIVDKLSKESDYIKRLCLLYDLAVVTWICSVTYKGIDVIHKELNSLYYNI